jgi:hypothetical protein
MLNPSTADAEVDDQTIRKCIGFTRLLGCGTLQVVNLFAFRARHPRNMKQAADPVGPENAAYVKQAVEGAEGPVICAWGTHGAYRNQDLTMLQCLAEMAITPLAYAITKEGHPQHPLLLPYSAEPMAFAGREPCRRSRFKSRTSPLKRS